MAYINEHNVAYGVLTEDAGGVTDAELLRAQRVSEFNSVYFYNDGTFQVNASDNQIKDNLLAVYLPRNATVYLGKFEPHWYKPAPGVKGRHIYVNSSPDETTVYEVGGTLATVEALKLMPYIHFGNITAPEWYTMTSKIADLEARVTALES